MAGGGPMAEELDTAFDALGDGDTSQFLREIRGILFYDLLPSLGILLVAPVVMAAGRRRGRRRPREWSLALNCFAVVAIGAVFWGLVMFGSTPARTVLHQGSFLLAVLGFVAAVCGLRATFPRFAIWFTAIGALLMFAVYVPAVNPIPGSSFSPLAALLAAAGLAGFAAIVLRGVSADEAAVSPPAAVP